MNVFLFQKHQNKVKSGRILFWLFPSFSGDLKSSCHGNFQVWGLPLTSFCIKSPSCRGERWHSTLYRNVYPRCFLGPSIGVLEEISQKIDKEDYLENYPAEKVLGISMNWSESASIYLCTKWVGH